MFRIQEERNPKGAREELGETCRRAGWPYECRVRPCRKGGLAFSSCQAVLSWTSHFLLCFYCGEIHIKFPISGIQYILDIAYKLHHCLLPDNPISSKGDAPPISSHSPWPLFVQPLATTNLSSITVDLSILDISRQLTHTTRSLMCLVSFTSMFSGSIHVVACVRTLLLFVAE